MGSARTGSVETSAKAARAGEAWSWDARAGSSTASASQGGRRSPAAASAGAGTEAASTAAGGPQWSQRQGRGWGGESGDCDRSASDERQWGHAGCTGSWARALAAASSEPHPHEQSKCGKLAKSKAKEIAMLSGQRTIPPHIEANINSSDSHYYSAAGAWQGQIFSPQPKKPPRKAVVRSVSP
jgi:hypothetical protein